MAVLLTGTASFTRFFVIGEALKDYQQSYLEPINDHAFWSIENSDNEEGYGWVTWNDFTSTDWQKHPPFRDNNLILSMRIDRRKIPKTLFTLHYRLAENEILEKQQFHPLSKGQKKELTETVERQLLRRTLPNPSLCDMLWRVDEMELYFGSTSQAAIERFTDLFSSTFKLDLRFAYPYALGERIKTAAMEADWETLLPAKFKPLNAATKTGEDREAQP